MVVELADTTDLKSVAREGIRVRPPAIPNHVILSPSKDAPRVILSLSKDRVILSIVSVSS